MFISGVSLNVMETIDNDLLKGKATLPEGKDQETLLVPVLAERKRGNSRNMGQRGKRLEIPVI